MRSEDKPDISLDNNLCDSDALAMLKLQNSMKYDQQTEGHIPVQARAFEKDLEVILKL